MKEDDILLAEHRFVREQSVKNRYGILEGWLMNHLKTQIFSG